MTFKVPEQHRITSGRLASKKGSGNSGAFLIPTRPGQAPIFVIASDQMGWEHVSASLTHRCPTWEEMCKVKAAFWDDGDCVMQLHPPKSDWISNYRYCLHLWRPVGVAIPTPPSWMVGVKELGEIYG